MSSRYHRELPKEAQTDRNEIKTHSRLYAAHQQNASPRIPRSNSALTRLGQSYRCPDNSEAYLVERSNRESLGTHRASVRVHRIGRTG